MKRVEVGGPRVSSVFGFLTPSHARRHPFLELGEILALHLLKSTTFIIIVALILCVCVYRLKLGGGDYGN